MAAVLLSLQISVSAPVMDPVVLPPVTLIREHGSLQTWRRFPSTVLKHPGISPFSKEKKLMLCSEALEILTSACFSVSPGRLLKQSLQASSENQKSLQSFLGNRSCKADLVITGKLLSTYRPPSDRNFETPKSCSPLYAYTAQICELPAQ